MILSVPIGNLIFMLVMLLIGNAICIGVIIGLYRIIKEIWRLLNE